LREALAEFDSRSAAGQDLLFDGGLELGRDGESRHWLTKGAARWERPSSLAREGEGALRLEGESAMRQVCPLPAGVDGAILSAHHRIVGTVPGELVLTISFLDAAQQQVGHASATSPSTDGWTESRLGVKVPRGSVTADVVLKGGSVDACSRLVVDDVRLEVVESKGSGR
jgi:hypothetical protein